MKKNQTTVQGTFSKLFGKKHGHPAAASLYATNPPWIFTQEAPEEGARRLDGIYLGDHRFDTVSESGTATLKARPRVRPLLTFLPLNAQENHGLAVPTPSVPEAFADKDVTGPSSLVNGNLRLYSSVGDLRPGQYGPDPPIPPPPPGPAPGPPQDPSPSPGESPPPPPPFAAPPPPPLLLEPPTPPSTAPPPPPVLDALSPPSTPTPPDFIPPAPPLAFLDPSPPSSPAPASPHTLGIRLFPPEGVPKWKSEVALSGGQPEAPRASPPRSPLAAGGDPHRTFPRSFKVPPPTPVRTSSIPTQGASPEEEGALRKPPSRLPLPPSFHVRPASQVYPDRVPEPHLPKEPGAQAPQSPGLSKANEGAATPPPAPPLPPPAPPLPPPAPPLPPAAPPLPSAGQAAPPSLGLVKSSKSSSPALKPIPKPKPPGPEDRASPEPVDWRDPSQMAKLRSELAAYLCGSRREDRPLAPRPGPNVPSQDKGGRKGHRPPEEPASPGLPRKTGAASSPALPPVDYAPQDPPAPSVRQIRDELEARLASEKEAKPKGGPLPPKPRPDGARTFENGTKPAAKNSPPLPITLLPKTTPGPSTQLKSTPGPATPPKTTPGPATPPKTTPGPATPPETTPGPSTPPKTTPGPTTPGSSTPPETTPGPTASSTATALPITSSPGEDFTPSEQQEKLASQKGVVPSQTQVEEPGSEAGNLPAPGAGLALPSRLSASREVPFLYKPHRSHHSPSREVAVVMPTLARGEAAAEGPVEGKEARGLPAKPRPPAQPADPLLRHPVTGEVVERGSPMALLLAARQRAQKGRPGASALGRSLPGSLRGHSSPPEAAGSDSIIYNAGRPNSFTVVPKSPLEAEKDSKLPAAPRPWASRPGRDPGGTEPSHRPRWTNGEPAAWARSAPAAGGLPKSFSSPPSPAYKREEPEELGFELIPPPPEFSNDPEPPAPAPQPLGRRRSPPSSSFPEAGRPLDLAPPPAPGFSRFPAPGGLERFPGAGRSLIKKRLYVGEPQRHPGTPRGATGRSLSSPNCFGPQPGGPEMRRVNSAGRARPGGLHARRASLEGGGRAAAEPRAAAPPGGGGGDCSLAPPAGRSPHGSGHYGSPVNTFTVRPGTRHPISYAYTGARRKATS
ncbi:uncharacterized protein C6orf132 homolog [Perognathus longimembris pacificus]|uniref:uncharacterized protein C6orf132 homolog n=1 Tax=Perognathus longimembris pacificus TaxID=214514 RepID=UPI00201986E0|nr:uncharacterized protein C6orf132 homolog [Perognathus longimembris pacificus]